MAAPISSTSSLPPEILYNIVAFTIMDEIDVLIRGDLTQLANPVAPAHEESTAPAPAPQDPAMVSLLCVSNQFRDVTFKVLKDAYNVIVEFNAGPGLGVRRLMTTVARLRKNWESPRQQTEDDLLITSLDKLNDLKHFTGFGAPLAQVYAISANMRAINALILRWHQPPAVPGAAPPDNIENLTRACNALDFYSSRAWGLVEDIRPSILSCAARTSISNIAERLRPVLIANEKHVEFCRRFDAGDLYNRMLNLMELSSHAHTALETKPVVKGPAPLRVAEEVVKALRGYDPTAEAPSEEILNALQALLGQLEAHQAQPQAA